MVTTWPPLQGNDQRSAAGGAAAHANAEEPAAAVCAEASDIQRQPGDCLSGDVVKASLNARARPLDFPPADSIRRWAAAG